MYYTYYPPYLCHHGIKGQKWGLRRYQNPDGSLTDAGRKRYAKAGDAAKLSVRNAHEVIFKSHWQQMSKADKKKMVAHRRQIENKSTEEYAKEVATERKRLIKSSVKNAAGVTALTGATATGLVAVAGAPIAIIPSVAITAGMNAVKAYKEIKASEAKAVAIVAMRNTFPKEK